jgi:uncharacterized membrane protein YeaQ/YmgE (transglycosylase-associated protein family)
VLGVAVTGAVFKALENEHIADALHSAGAITLGEKGEVSGLLSGSEAAQERLAQLAPAAAGSVERLVEEAFMPAFVGAMVVLAIASALGVAACELYERRQPAGAPAAPAEASPG